MDEWRLGSDYLLLPRAVVRTTKTLNCWKNFFSTLEMIADISGTGGKQPAHHPQTHPTHHCALGSVWGSGSGGGGGGRQPNGHRLTEIFGRTSLQISTWRHSLLSNLGDSLQRVICHSWARRLLLGFKENIDINYRLFPPRVSGPSPLAGLDGVHRFLHYSCTMSGRHAISTHPFAGQSGSRAGRGQQGAVARYPLS